MRISNIWSSFTKENTSPVFFKNSKFEYKLSFQTNDFVVSIKFYYLDEKCGQVEIKRENIPQSTFSAMLQDDCWEQE